MSEKRDMFDVTDCLSGITSVATTLQESGELQVPMVFDSELRAAWRALGFDEQAIDEMLADACRRGTP